MNNGKKGAIPKAVDTIDRTETNIEDIEALGLVLRQIRVRGCDLVKIRVDFGREAEGNAPKPSSIESGVAASGKEIVRAASLCIVEHNKQTKSSTS